MKRRNKGQKRKYANRKQWEEHKYFPEAEEKWKDNFWKIKSFDMHLNLDTDRDGVKDKFDCQPFDPTRQDNMMIPTRPDVQRPTQLPMTTRDAPPEMVRKERVEGPVGLSKASIKVSENITPPRSQPTINAPISRTLPSIQRPTTPSQMIKPTLQTSQNFGVTIKPDAPALSREQQAMLNTYLNSITNKGPRVAIEFPQWVKDYVSQYGNFSPR